MAIRRQIGVVVVMALAGWLGGVCRAAEPGAAAEQPAAPSWQALTEKAQDLAAEQYSPEDLAAQVAAKGEHLQSLYQQRATLEAQLASVITTTGRSLEQIGAIGDPVLRDESMLRFRGAKETRLKTIRATLDAVNSAIDQEEKEQATLQRILQERQAEASLYGQVAPAGGSYRSYLEQEARRVQASELQALSQFRQARLAGLQSVVMPQLQPMVPDLTTAVLGNERVVAIAR